MSDNHRDTETAVVINVQGNTALVELRIQSACESCGARIVCTPDGTGKRRLTVSNPVEARVGNTVLISESSNFLLKLSALQYGIPLVGFLTGIFFVYYLNPGINSIPHEVVSFLGGICGLIVGAFVSHSWASRLAGTSNTYFSIQKIVS